MSESNKIEKELNFKVIDNGGLREYLQSHCKFIGTVNIGFDYFDNKNDPNMYARIERVLGEDEDETFYLTAKRKITGEGIVSNRKEVTVRVNNRENIIALLEVMGLSYIDSKAKVRERYEFDLMNIDVDSWYDENFENYVESRIDIEGEREDKIIAFSKKIKVFIEE